MRIILYTLLVASMSVLLTIGVYGLYTPLPPPQIEAQAQCAKLQEQAWRKGYNQSKNEDRSSFDQLRDVYLEEVVGNKRRYDETLASYNRAISQMQYQLNKKNFPK